MARSILLLVFLFCISSAFSQTNPEPCLFDHYTKKNAHAVNSSEFKISEAVKQSPLYKKAIASAVKTIPVVVHVIHIGGSENISDAQINSQITVLNQDYRKMTGTNGFGNGVDTEVEFCLAKKDPNGKCTNGIIRINSPLSNHQTFQRSLLTQLSNWDNKRYLNIYVVRNINNGGGIAGYSSFPGGPDNEDGIVVRHIYFGKIGTAAASLGRTTTHEVGHWLGLYHTFNSGCGVDTCADGDYVCDTPPAAAPNYGCPTAANTCTNDNLPDQVKNYMDYSNDACKNMFSNGQKTRIQATLTMIRDTIWQPWNLDSTGCDSGFVNGNCLVIPNFACLTRTICVGNNVTFYNTSQNSPTSYQWKFPGGSPSVSTLANPTITYTNVGVFPVTLIAANANGTDSLMQKYFITVINPPVGQALPYFEGFESTTFPSNGMIIDNPDNGITWVKDSVAAAFQGTACAKINNLINTNYGQSDALLLPRFDFTTITGTPYLSFKWAYAKSDPSYSDEMIVLVSKDCGVVWSTVFYTSGSSMTTAVTQTTPYVPGPGTVWKSANINLGLYSSYQNVQIKIVNVTDGGNNLYVDNINLGIPPAGMNEFAFLENVSVFPNPVSEEMTVIHNLTAGKNLSVELMDLTGRLLYQTHHLTENSRNKVFVPQGLQHGTYLLRLSIDGKVKFSKIILNPR
ncbi:MAG: domain containing protein [Bacteroidetes bacterium]|nr:domain containing protein [Bacteroidota bacterium]